MLVLQTDNGLNEEGIVVFDKIPFLGFGYDILGRGFTPHSDKTKLAIGDPERKFLHKLWLWVSLSFSPSLSRWVGEREKRRDVKTSKEMTI